VHLGLYGKFRRHSLPLPEPRGQVRLRVVGESLAFDLNGPTACELLTASEIKSLRNRLGTDPLRADSDPDFAWQKISRSRSSIGTLLMDQSVIAGVGNIYRSEILYLLGIHPERRGNTLSESEFMALWDLTVSLLKIGKRYNRIITTHPDEIGKPRTRMNRDERLWIYKKPACMRCMTPIQSWKIAARTVYACPTCQPQT